MGRPRPRSVARRSEHARRRIVFLSAAGSLVVLAFVLLGLLVGNLSQPAVSRSDGRSDAATKASRGSGGARSRSISTQGPIASAPTTTSSPATQPSPLGPKAASYLASRLGTATAAIYDVSTGQTWYFHPGNVQDTASIVKVDIMATLMGQSMTSGQPISGEDQNLLTSMIEVSDNDAATALWNAVGGPAAIAKFNASIGMTETTPSNCLTCAGFPWPGWGLTTTTAADQITLLRHIIAPNSEIDQSNRDEAVDLLENVTVSERWGVSGGVLLE